MSDSRALDDMLARLRRLEAADCARRVVMRYFQLCDTLGPDTPLEELGALFAHDDEWQGRGRYRKAFGHHNGREAIMAMLASYAEPQHFALNAHYLSSEDIEVLSDDSVSARWMMLQVSTYRDGRSDLRSAALAIDLVVEDCMWRITRFVTENIFSRDVGPWNDEAPISVPLASATD